MDMQPSGPVRPYEAYIDQRKSLNEGERAASKVFDQAMLTLPAGALALSMAFMRDVVQQPTQTQLLVYGWYLFGAALLAALFSLLTSQQSYCEDRNRLDREQRENRLLPDKPNWWSRATGLLNYASIVLFTTGVILIALFAGANLTQS